LRVNLVDDDNVTKFTVKLLGLLTIVLQVYHKDAFEGTL